MPSSGRNERVALQLKKLRDNNPMRFSTIIRIVLLSVCISGTVLSSSSLSTEINENANEEAQQKEQNACQAGERESHIPEFVSSRRSTYFSDLEKYMETYYKPITLDNNWIYSGQMSKDRSQMNGLGLLKKDREVYAGCFVNGEFEGFGILVYNYDGESVVGQWSRGKINGMATVVQIEGNNRIKFTGKFVDNKMHGYGVYDDIFGTYEGEYRNNKRHGFGTVFSKEQKFTYVGELRQGKFNGHGVLKDPRFTYTGTFKNDYKHGIGSLKRLVPGEEYEYVGTFENDKHHGWGYMKHFAFQTEFEGHFVEGTPTYIGRLKLPNGSVVNKCLDASHDDVDVSAEVFKTGEIRSFGLGRSLKCQTFQYLSM